MTHEEFLAARDVLRLNDEQLAAELGLTPHIVAAWTDGSVAIPRRQSQYLAWRAGVEQRVQAAAAAGIPDCPWLASLDSESLEREPARMMAEIRQHQVVCAVCAARSRFDAENFGPLPELPPPAWLAPLAWLQNFPAWLRPVIVGATAAAVMAMLRVLLVTRRSVAEDGLFLQAVIGVLGAAAAGALLGLAYSALRRRRRNLGS